MASTIKHLNAKASFLLTFEPLLSSTGPEYEPEPFHILLDPLITGPSKIFHSKISKRALLHIFTPRTAPAGSCDHKPAWKRPLQ